MASREGYPEEVVSDCGSVFTSDRFVRYLGTVGSKHVRVTVDTLPPSGLGIGGTSEQGGEDGIADCEAGEGGVE